MISHLLFCCIRFCSCADGAVPIPRHFPTPFSPQPHTPSEIYSWGTGGLSKQQRCLTTEGGTAKMTPRVSKSISKQMFLVVVAILSFPSPNCLPLFECVMFRPSDLCEHSSRITLPVERHSCWLLQIHHVQSQAKHLMKATVF